MTTSLALLRTRLDILASALLPTIADVTAPMSPEEAVRVNAYLVLAHAGVEEHVESYLLGIVDEAMASATDRVVPSCFLHMALRYGAELTAKPPVPVGVNACNAVRGLYSRKVINANNGIRASHLHAMCKPLGVDFAGSVEDVHGDTVRAMETLAAKRGSRAHGTDNKSAEETIYPDPAKQMIEDVLTGLSAMLETIRAEVLTISMPVAATTAAADVGGVHN